jgi:hypothetical protein
MERFYQGFRHLNLDDLVFQLHSAAQRSRPVDNLLYFLLKFQPANPVQK